MNNRIGRVVKNVSDSYDILYDNTKILTLKAKGLFRHNKIEVKVGDIVTFDDEKILSIEKRKNDFIRPYVSNVDYVVIVTSLKEPDINFKLLDEFIINVEMENVTPVLVFTKLDLLDESQKERMKETLSYYGKYYSCFYSSRDGLEDKEGFISLLKDKVSVLSGQTGSGKSSLLNSIDPTLELKTQEISLSLGRGKHTTRHTEIMMTNSLMIADTPGFSSLDLTYIKSQNLKDCFKDFAEHLNECKYNECMHMAEPMCKIKELVDEGSILKSRYENYKDFYLELKEKEKTFKRRY